MRETETGFALADCGTPAVVRGACLRRGYTKSCGCLKRECCRIDLIGKRFGRLLVTAYAGNKYWSCVCDCGTRVDVRGQFLREGQSRSCGCRRQTSQDRSDREAFRTLDRPRLCGGQKLRVVLYLRLRHARCRRGSRVADRPVTILRLSIREMTAPFKIHGRCETREYSSWHSMKARCLYPCVAGFENYGGRGITFCEEWHPFLGWLADMVVAPAGLFSRSKRPGRKLRAKQLPLG